MSKNIYLFSDGYLSRDKNTLLFVFNGKKNYIPIENVDSISVFGEISITKSLLSLCTKQNIPLHFFNYYEYYIGTYYPRNIYNSGFVILEQVKHYQDKEKRIFLAKSIIDAAVSNMLFNLNNYKSSQPQLVDYIKSIETIKTTLGNQTDIPALMNVEGQVRKLYYESFNFILKNGDFEFTTRIKNPPNNPLNAMISFGNSLCYTTCLSEIYRTHLDPRIGYLHETNNRAFTLNLDIAEIFKPIIVDTVIFTLINKNIISLSDFDESLNYSYMKKSGCEKFVKQYEEKLATTFYYAPVKKNVSYKRLIRMECYKLYKHLMGEKLYQPYIHK